MGKGKKALNITEGLVKNATKPKSYVNLGKEEGSGVVDALRGTLDAAAPQPDWSVYDTSENIVGEGLGLEGLFGGKKVYLDQDPQKVKRANEAIKEFNSFLTESKVNSEDLVAETGDYFNSTRKQALDNDLGMVYRTDDVPSYNTFDPNDYNLSTDNSFISTPDFLGYDDLQKVIKPNDVVEYDKNFKEIIGNTTGKSTSQTAQQADNLQKDAQDQAQAMGGSWMKYAVGGTVVTGGLVLALNSTRGQQTNAQLYGQQPLY